MIYKYRMLFPKSTEEKFQEVMKRGQLVLLVETWDTFSPLVYPAATNGARRTIQALWLRLHCGELKSQPSISTLHGSFGEFWDYKP